MAQVALRISPFLESNYPAFGFVTPPVSHWISSWRTIGRPYLVFHPQMSLDGEFFGVDWGSF